MNHEALVPPDFEELSEHEDDDELEEGPYSSPESSELLGSSVRRVGFCKLHSLCHPTKSDSKEVTTENSETKRNTKRKR